jgi:hypothetical protein
MEKKKKKKEKEKREVTKPQEWFGHPQGLKPIKPFFFLSWGDDSATPN